MNINQWHVHLYVSFVLCAQIHSQKSILKPGWRFSVYMFALLHVVFIWTSHCEVCSWQNNLAFWWNVNLDMWICWCEYVYLYFCSVIHSSFLSHTQLTKSINKYTHTHANAKTGKTSRFILKTHLMLFQSHIMILLLYKYYSVRQFGRQCIESVLKFKFAKKISLKWNLFIAICAMQPTQSLYIYGYHKPTKTFKTSNNNGENLLVRQLFHKMLSICTRHSNKMWNIISARCVRDSIYCNGLNVQQIFFCWRT